MVDSVDFSEVQVERYKCSWMLVGGYLLMIDWLVEGRETTWEGGGEGVVVCLVMKCLICTLLILVELFAALIIQRRFPVRHPA